MGQKRILCRYNRTKKQIAEYIKHQFDKAQIADQISLKSLSTRLRAVRTPTHKIKRPLRDLTRVGNAVGRTVRGSLRGDIRIMLS